MQEAFPDSHDPKSRLRAEMRRHGCGRPADDAATIRAVDAWLADHPAVSVVATFAALPGEVDLEELVARHPERRWVYPRVVGAFLDFHHVADPTSAFARGRFGVREPLPHLPCVPVTGIDAFLCPGLAFDARGGRLGRGRGYYDRTLARARSGAWKIGICHAHQIVPDTFPEPHDVPMDLVLC